MPPDPAEHAAHAPPPTDGPPILYVQMTDMTDDEREELARRVAYLAASESTMAWRAAPACVITPSEAAEELDDREAEELAVIDEIEREARALGRERNWEEHDAAVEADRRFLLDSVRVAAEVLAMHAKSFEEDSGDVKFRLSRAPHGFEDEVAGFLRGVHRMGMDALRGLEEYAREGGGE